jgi:glycosyltransferase involved in cell wall biosynthesis
MVLGIDACHIRGGGGSVTHFVESLRAADPLAHGFSQVIVRGDQAILDRIEDRPWLLKSREPLLEESLLYRIFWQRYRLSRRAREAGCAVLFVPSGSFLCNFRPTVTMSQNMLPFEWRELRRFGWSWRTLKLVVLRIVHARGFRRADGLIFLTRYSRDSVMRTIKTTAARTTIIPHGIGGRFACPPREQLAISHYSEERPFRVLYVSSVAMYKHQWQAVEAVRQLRASGLPVALELVGPAYPPALKRLTQTLDRVDPSGRFARYCGAVPHGELPARYRAADLCLFASSCENLPNNLLEGMASGLAIACSNRGPMPEVLGQAGLYFDPENPRSMASALKALIDSPELRARMANASFERSRAYSWKRCARETFDFLADVARGRSTSSRRIA